MKTVADLTAFVVSECTAIDRESRFDAMLNECYSFEKVGGPFEHMQPSAVLAECNPTAYRCGVNDYADSEGWIEIEGENYDSYEVEKAREEFLDEMRSELSDLESELEALHDKDDLDEEADIDRRDELNLEVPALECRIAELEAHTF